MNAESDPEQPQPRSARWVAYGFLGAFALSVFTVIYTGLNVQGRGTGDFDVGFRPVTMAVGDVRTIDLLFDIEGLVSEAVMTVSLPAGVELVDPGFDPAGRRQVALTPGENAFHIEVEATGSGSGYLVARLIADEPVGLYRVFLTVEDSAQ